MNSRIFWTGWAIAAAAVSGARGEATALSPVAVPSSSSSSSSSFSFSADDLPIKQALVLFARSNHLTIVPDLDVEGRVTVDFHDLPLDLAMSALLEANGYYCEQEGRLMRVRNRETRLFQIDYIRVARASQGSNAVQISSVGSSAGSSGGGGGGASGGSSNSGIEGSEMTMTNTSAVNFWADLGDELKTLVSPTGNFTINSLAGTVLVRDSHRNIESIAQFLHAVSISVVRQIDLEVEIYEVELNNSNQFGINWQNVANNLVVNSIPGTQSLGGGGGLIVQNPVFGAAPGDPAAQATFTHGGLTAVVQALRQQGVLKVVSKPRLRTLNNQPAVVRVGQDVPVFTHQVTQSPGTPPVITTNDTVTNVTIGTVLSITPQISADDIVTLDVTPAVSRLVSTTLSPDGTISAPVIDIRQASSLVRVRSGTTVVMGGLVQDSSTSTERKIPILSDLPLLGKLFTGKDKETDRTELVFFLTPRIVPDAGPSGNTTPPAM
ncbi:MAG TPA: secretin N-terminal domain-containing protein [Opitutaceae bacterium]